MVHPFALPAAVGGIDIPGKERWRRRSEIDILADPLDQLTKPEFWPAFTDEKEVAGAYVRLFDITRSFSQRIEG